MKRKSEPVLRFEGFIDPWEQRKVGELGEITVKVILPSNSPDTLFYEYSMPAYDLDKKPVQVKGRDIALARVVISDPVLLINKLNVKKQRIWIVKHAGKNAVCTGEFLPFKSNKTDLEFIRQQLLSERVTEELSSLSAGSSNSQKRITPQVLLDFSIMVPSKQIESQKIAKFLGEFDSLITLHQRKLEALKKTKVSMLEKIFPKEGEQYPEIRFEGFTDPWEQRKLSSIASMHARIGWQNLRKSEFLDKGDYLLVTGTNFEDGVINFNDCHYVKKERYDQDLNIQIHDNSILITKDGTLGKVAFVQGLHMPATLNAGVFNVLVQNSNVADSRYLYHYLRAPFLMKHVEQCATGGTIKHLNQNLLANFPIALPNILEQRKLGALLSGIDSLITLHQRKLDGLKMIKKAFQSKMLI